MVWLPLRRLRDHPRTYMKMHTMAARHTTPPTEPMITFNCVGRLASLEAAREVAALPRPSLTGSGTRGGSGVLVGLDVCNISTGGGGDGPGGGGGRGGGTAGGDDGDGGDDGGCGGGGGSDGRGGGNSHLATPLQSSQSVPR